MRRRMLIVALAFLLLYSLGSAASREVEVKSKEAKILGMLPSFVKAKNRNRNIIGKASRGAKMTVVKETENWCKVEIRADEDRITIYGWVRKDDLKDR